MHLFTGQHIAKPLKRVDEGWHLGSADQVQTSPRDCGLGQLAVALSEMAPQRLPSAFGITALVEDQQKRGYQLHHLQDSLD